MRIIIAIALATLLLAACTPVQEDLPNAPADVTPQNETPGDPPSDIDDVFDDDGGIIPPPIPS
ncbi:MAG: hypothetical protein V1735_01775 [Nanoarchaeota archaeon]